MNTRIRRCLFRKNDCHTFECYCTEAEAFAAINFIRFLD